MKHRMVIILSITGTRWPCLYPCSIKPDDVLLKLVIKDMHDLLEPGGRSLFCDGENGMW